MGNFQNLPYGLAYSHFTRMYSHILRNLPWRLYLHSLTVCWLPNKPNTLEFKKHNFYIEINVLLVNSMILVLAPQDINKMKIPNTPCRFPLNKRKNLKLNFEIQLQLQLAAANIKHSSFLISTKLSVQILFHPDINHLQTFSTKIKGLHTA